MLIFLQIGTLSAQNDSTSYFASWLYQSDLDGMTITSAKNGIFKLPSDWDKNTVINFIKKKEVALYVIDCAVVIDNVMYTVDPNNTHTNWVTLSCKFIILETFVIPAEFQKRERSVTYMVGQGEKYLTLDYTSLTPALIEDELNKKLIDGNPLYKDENYKILFTGFWNTGVLSAPFFNSLANPHKKHILSVTLIR